MTTTESTSAPRLLTPAELAEVIRTLRDIRQWSQETLATLSGVSVRTVQRVEKGDPSDIDTRRALAHAFDFEDLDAFSKPYSIPTPDELKKAQEDFQKECLVLDSLTATKGRELATLFEISTMDMSNPTIELEREPAENFAGLIDYLRDYRDCAELHSEVQKLDVYDELQQYIDALDGAGIAIAYAKRNTKLTNENWQDKTPWSVVIVYLFAFRKGEVPNKVIVSKNVAVG